jgi:hypothetical protein
MVTRRQFVRITVLVCVALLQLQVLAAGALACQHAGDAATTATASGLAAACPHGGLVTPIDRDDDAPGAIGHCQKCALDLCVFGGLGLLTQQPLLASSGPSRPTPGAQRHFYLFSPDPTQKPPITLSG